MTCSYFDQSVATKYEKYQRAKTPECHFKPAPRINKEMINVSGAKNLKLLREQGKIKMVREKPAMTSKTLKYSSQGYRKNAVTSRPVTEGGVF